MASVVSTSTDAAVAKKHQPQKQYQSKLGEIKTKLVTHEDGKFHSHKIFGVLALAAMAHRFSMVGRPGDMGFESHPEWTIPTLLIHLCLGLSALKFKIPLKRIRDGGRIWPEYRLHALVFACRSIFTIVLYSYEKKYSLDPNYNINLLIVLGGMAAADLASWSVGANYQSHSVRDLDAHPGVRFFFSFMQFNASAGLLFGLRRCTLPYVIIFVVQTTPFVATLRRKNLFTSNFWGAFIYGAMLVGCFAISQYEYYRAGQNTFLLVRTIGQLAALMRMSPLPKAFKLIQNKYVIWTLMFLLIRKVRPHLDDMATEQLKAVWAGTLVLVLTVGWFKTQKATQTEKPKPTTIEAKDNNKSKETETWWEYLTKTGDENSNLTFWEKFKTRLLTTGEDPYHNHKFFGLLVIMSFAFRLWNVGESDMAFATYPALTVPTMTIHFMLNASSFLFKIPKQRIKHGGRIYPEYRLHSLIFTMRSHICIAWYMYERHYNLEPNYDFNFVVVIGAIAAAHLASIAQGRYRSNSVRGVDASPVWKFVASTLQFNGTAGILFGLRRFTIVFLPILLMQVTAFMGTLQRKNLIGYIGLIFFSMLFVNSLVIQYYEYNRVSEHVQYAVRIIGFGCALLRLSPLPKSFGLLQSRYTGWILAYLALREVRPRLEEIPIGYMKITLASILASLALAGYVKVYKTDYYNGKESKKFD